MLSLPCQVKLELLHDFKQLNINFSLLFSVTYPLSGKIGTFAWFQTIQYQLLVEWTFPLPHASVTLTHDPRIKLARTVGAIDFHKTYYDLTWSKRSALLFPLLLFNLLFNLEWEFTEEYNGNSRTICDSEWRPVVNVIRIQ